MSQELVKALKQQRERIDAGPWVRVEDRLPEKGNPVLVITASGYYHAAELIGTSFYDTGRLERVGIVTHWMPLPEPPTQ